MDISAPSSRIDHAISNSLTTVLIVVVMLECIQVLFRYFLHAPILWIEETLIFPAIWLYFLGCANAARENTQISADLVVAFMKDGPQKSGMQCASSFLATVISAWATWWTWDYALYATKVWKKTALLFWPTALAEYAFFVGMLITTIYTAKQTIRYFRDFRHSLLNRS